jgi:mRNA-degrading endonuclease RelE of RelBE toxin-antitoxin system
MTWEVEFSDDAIRHLRALAARVRNVILDAIEKLLTSEPNVATPRRKPLRPNPLAE